jgi:hypothetical protein
MPTLYLPCANCHTSTLHRPPHDSRIGGDDAAPVVQCEACGTMTPLPEGTMEESSADAEEVTQLLASLPAMSQKRAHGKLEELLYEHRGAIETSDAFSEAMASFNATECEMQDIKVQESHRDEADLIITFTYYALGEGDSGDDSSPCGLRVDGTGRARISPRGQIGMEEVTASASEA